LKTVVLDRTLQGFPRKTKVFVNQHRQILDTDIALAPAEHVAHVIGLASG
jgi:hypothetical protein